MLTDDDLTHALGDAFRVATQNLTYTGKRRPPRSTSVVVSTTAFAGVAAIASVAVATAGGSGSGTTHLAAPRHPLSHHTAGLGVPRHGRTVTQTMKLAGLSITYSYPAGAPDPVIATVVQGGVPAGATPVALDRTDAKAWSGTDAATGDNALYVELASGSLAGKVYALLSPTWTEPQLLELVEDPAPVPAVPAS